MLDNDQCWQAVITRDKGRDGSFFFGVTTTGVYCRPSCPARRPLRRNVRFYKSAGEAEQDGLRPCRRCRPNADADPTSQRMRGLCDFIRRNCDSGEPLTLARLGEEAGMSPFHLQRTFKAAIGLTPRQFVEACRLEALKHELRGGRKVTNAVYEAGFGSGSRVYERLDTRFGMTPAQYRERGQNVAISWATEQTPLGLMMIGATDRGLCFVQFGSSEEHLLAELKREYPAATIHAAGRRHSQQLAAWMESLKRYLDGGVPHLDLPVDVRGTAFQFRVWQYLQTIPTGGGRSYAEVARGIGKPAAVRGVARACAANRVAIVIPCHRVIRADGDAGGYRWGMQRKKALLDREGANLSRSRSAAR